LSFLSFYYFPVLVNSHINSLCFICRLGVPSVPFGHIYHPDVGLVEEKKINKKVFGEFRDSLDSYVNGSCDIPSDEEAFEAEAEEDGFQ
jgi:hypothetical protein